MQTSICVSEKGISVTGPYSETNNREWRVLGGKFSGDSWLLPDTLDVRIVLAEMFGAKSDTGWFLVPAVGLSDGQAVQIGGYILASRRGRDSSVVLASGVALHAGRFRSSGGSVKNPRVCLDGDVVFRLLCRTTFAEARGLQPVPETVETVLEV